MKAYLLINFAPDAEIKEALHAVKQPGIETIDLILGQYDAIVTVEARDMAQLGELAARIRRCPGIRESVTCPVIAS